MEVQGLLDEKFQNCQQFFAEELREAGVHDWVEALPVEGLIAQALSLQPYWQFVESGEIEQILRLADGAIAGNETASKVVSVYMDMSRDRKEKLKSYLKFFLHCVQTIIQ